MGKKKKLVHFIVANTHMHMHTAESVKRRLQWGNYAYWQRTFQPNNKEKFSSIISYCLIPFLRTMYCVKGEFMVLERVRMQIELRTCNFMLIDLCKSNPSPTSVLKWWYLFICISVPKLTISHMSIRIELLFVSVRTVIS